MTVVKSNFVTVDSVLLSMWTSLRQTLIRKLSHVKSACQTTWIKSETMLPACEMIKYWPWKVPTRPSRNHSMRPTWSGRSIPTLRFCLPEPPMTTPLKCRHSMPRSLRWLNWWSRLLLTPWLLPRNDERARVNKYDQTTVPKVVITCTFSTRVDTTSMVAGSTQRTSSKNQQWWRSTLKTSWSLKRAKRNHMWLVLLIMNRMKRVSTVFLKVVWFIATQKLSVVQTPRLFRLVRNSNAIVLAPTCILYYPHDFMLVLPSSIKILFLIPRPLLAVLWPTLYKGPKGQALVFNLSVSRVMVFSLKSWMSPSLCLLPRMSSMWWKQQTPSPVQHCSWRQRKTILFPWPFSLRWAFAQL